MPIAMIYLASMFTVIILWFLLLKRPIYGGVFVSFIVLLAVTGTWGNVLTYVNSVFKVSLLYSIVLII
mgnify:CR=1 FL=1|jgi:hypothetical protein